MAVIEVQAPRLNANEDELLVAAILVAPGATVTAGQEIFTVETTKASFEVESTATGTLGDILVEVGRMVDVGAPMATIHTDGPASTNPATANAAPPAITPQTEIKITTKARLRAEQLGLDLTTIAPTDGRIGIAEVEAAATTAPGAPAATAPKHTSGHASSLTPYQAVIVGGGGHAATIGEVARACGWNIKGAVDAKLKPGTTVIDGIDVLGDETLLDELLANGVRTAFIGIGGATSAETRRKVYDHLKGKGFHLPPLVHPSAHFGTGSKLGAATYVLPGAMVGPRCEIGSNVIVNANVTIAHDCRIEDHVHLAPSAILAGTVTVGEATVIGMAATVLFGCSIGHDCLIHNNVAVLSNVKDDTEMALNRTTSRS